MSGIDDAADSEETYNATSHALPKRNHHVNFLNSAASVEISSRTNHGTTVTNTPIINVENTDDCLELNSLEPSSAIPQNHNFEAAHCTELDLNKTSLDAESAIFAKLDEILPSVRQNDTEGNQKYAKIRRTSNADTNTAPAFAHAPCSSLFIPSSSTIAPATSSQSSKMVTKSSQNIISKIVTKNFDEVSPTMLSMEENPAPAFVSEPILVPPPAAAHKPAINKQRRIFPTIQMVGTMIEVRSRLSMLRDADIIS